MGRVSTAVDLPYPVERVFRVATRIPDLPRWLPEIVRAELLDEPLAPGARIRLQLGPGAANAVITGTVGRLEAPGLIELTGSGGPLTVAVRTTLAARGPDATTAQLELELGTPPFLGFIAKEAERRIAAELPLSMARFRALLDAEPA